jgi:hypothetical protein
MVGLGQGGQGAVRVARRVSARRSRYGSVARSRQGGLGMVR